MSRLKIEIQMEQLKGTPPKEVSRMLRALAMSIEAQPDDPADWPPVFPITDGGGEMVGRAEVY